MPKKTDALAALKKELSDGRLRPVYLLYGEEAYIRGQYEHKITDMVPDAGFPEFNHFIFEGTETELSDYDDAWESFPMMTDKKLILIRDSKIFKRVSEEVKSFWQNKFKHLADDTVVVFSEDEVDKRGVLYKAVSKAGSAIEFTYQTEADLVTWVNRQALKAKLKMSKDTAQYLVGVVDPGLGNLTNEFNKLLSYCDGSISKNDIDKIVSKAMSIRIFDLTDAIMYRDGDTAMRVVNELRTSNESAFGILYLLHGSAEKILKTKLCGTTNKFEAAKLVGIAPFLADKYLKSAKGFSEASLARMLTRVPEIDLEIKSGRIDQWIALEQYITECIYYR